jgi:hypothetical protein
MPDATRRPSTKLWLIGAAIVVAVIVIALLVL